MERYAKALLIIVLGSLTIARCSPTIELPQERSIHEPTRISWHCDPVPDTFKNTDLVGIWQARYGTSRTDTLSISISGYYTQTYVNESTGYHYESEPQKWWIERLKDGGIYVHFERMLYCGGVLGCINPQEEPSYYDFCSDSWLIMEREFMLAAIGDSSVPRGIWLRHMRPAGNETFFAQYILLD